MHKLASCFESSVIRLEVSAKPFAHAISSRFVPLPSLTISDKCAIKYAIFFAVEIISLSLWSHYNKAENNVIFMLGVEVRS